MDFEPRTSGVWAPFAEIGERSFMPKWAVEGIDEIVSAHPDKIKSISFELWAVTSWDGKHTSKQGVIDFTWVDAANPLSQDELDHIPAVRRLERLAKELWEFFPISHNDETANVDAETFHCVFHRDGIDFLVQDWDETETRASADWAGGEWTFTEKVVLSADLTEMERALFNAETALDAVSLDNLGYDDEKLPAPRKAWIDEDWIYIEFERGLLPAYVRDK